MSGIRYKVLDLPVKGAGAFLPTTFPVFQAISYGKVKLTGAPGTLPIPSPKPEVTSISPERKTQPSYVAPDIILPDKYIAYANNMGPEQDAGVGMTVRRMNPLPVPAKSWLSAVKRAMVVPKVGGMRAMAWPRSFQRWPSGNTTNNGAGRGGA